MMDLELAQENVSDHARHPRCVGSCADATHRGGATNASCGDRLELDLRAVDGRIAEVRIRPSGCVISTASSSLLTEWLVGKTIDEAKTADEARVQELLGIPVGITRAKCANLPLRALHEALK
jgi:nitrogen fixation NifU-like protein